MSLRKQIISQITLKIIYINFSFSLCNHRQPAWLNISASTIHFQLTSASSSLESLVSLVKLIVETKIECRNRTCRHAKPLKVRLDFSQTNNSYRKLNIIDFDGLFKLSVVAKTILNPEIYSLDTFHRTIQ